MISHLLVVVVHCGCSLVQGRVATYSLDTNVGQQESRTLGCFAKQKQYQRKPKKLILK